MQRLRIPEAVADWTELQISSSERCSRCAPKASKIYWTIPRKIGVRMVMCGCEDPAEAAAVEKAFKVRPDAFVVQLRKQSGILKYS